MHSTTNDSTCDSTMVSRLQHASRRASLLGLALVGLLSLPVSAAIYRTVDAAGNVTYTDQPPPGQTAAKTGIVTEKIEIKTPNTFDKPQSEPAYEPWLPDIEEAAAGYQSLQITSPAHDESIRENAGNVVVSGDLKPGLKVGDALHLELDGTLNPEPADGFQLQLANIPRGTHRIRLVVLGSNGERKIESKEQIFHLQRYSVNFNRANN